jgi:hypothetical protein
MKPTEAGMDAIDQVDKMRQHPNTLEWDQRNNRNLLLMRR